MLHMILLAAGESRRFGENKLLYEIEGKPMFRYAFDAVSEAAALINRQEAAEVIVVTAYEEIAAYGRGKGARIVRNAHSDRGISYSIRLGLAAAETERTVAPAEESAVADVKGINEKRANVREAEYDLFCVADQPKLTAADLAGFVAAFLKEGCGQGKTIGICASGGRQGNPCIFHEKYRDQLKALFGDIGGKAIAKRYSEEVYLYEIHQAEKLEDIDYRPM